MLKKYCGDFTIWTYPPPPYVTISYHFRVPPPPPPVTPFLNDPLLKSTKKDISRINDEESNNWKS